MFKPSDAVFHFLELKKTDKLPTQFTYPFFYEPHPLCVRAANEVQNYLHHQSTINHYFGLDSKSKGAAIGKMFGVLLVKSKDGSIGYLAAFSGKLAESNYIPGFVPPIFDTLNPKGFYKNGEVQLNRLNHHIETHQNHEAIQLAHLDLQKAKKTYEEELKAFKAHLKVNKKQRDIMRKESQLKMTTADYDELLEQLRQESIQDHFRLRDFKLQGQNTISELSLHLKTLKAPIENLKKERRELSAHLQHQLHQQYNFKNAKGAIKNVRTLFKEAPPSAAGECAAPKLLQFAYDNAYDPLAMAEFWWGVPPPSEVRQHKEFYPSCRSRCEPILGFMMQGLNVAPNPITTIPEYKAPLRVLYEDDYMLAIDKPEEFLSVPGKTINDSVLTRLQHRYPKAKGPLLLHRLDMSTSGILLAAKNEKTHKNLQKQFVDRSIQKRYIAILDGRLSSDEGQIKLPLRVDLNNRPRQLVCYHHGKPALTQYEVIERNNHRTRVYFYPHTGRTHQLRVHAAHHKGLGIPIVGDDLYGNKANRLHLHAEQIRFMHPVTKEQLTINSPCPF